MVKSKPAIYSDLAKVDATTDEDIARQIAEDPDTAPELTDEWFDKADLHYGEVLLRRGRGRPALDRFTSRVRRYARVGGAMGGWRRGSPANAISGLIDASATPGASKAVPGHRLAIETRPRFPICSRDGSDETLVTGAWVAVASPRRAGPARPAFAVDLLYFQQKAGPPVLRITGPGHGGPVCFPCIITQNTQPAPHSLI